LLNALGWVIGALGYQCAAGLLFKHALHWVRESARRTALGYATTADAECVTDSAASAEMFQGFVVGHGHVSIVFGEFRVLNNTRQVI
jgi:hypothetical protein